MSARLLPDPGRIAIVADRAGQSRADPQAILERAEQKDAAVAGQPSRVEGGGDFLAAERWKGDRKGGASTPEGVAVLMIWPGFSRQLIHYKKQWIKLHPPP
jgi:hypothetical protein